MGCQILTLICEEPQAAGVNQMFPSPEIIIFNSQCHFRLQTSGGHGHHDWHSHLSLKMIGPVSAEQQHLRCRKGCVPSSFI